MRIITLLPLLTSLMACAQSGARSHVTGPDLLQRIEAGDAPVVVDVRSGWEYAAGHVPGAVHMPFWSTVLRAGEIDGPKNRQIVLYCQHGPRAGLAKLGLRARGFENVAYLDGHMSRWKAAGLPTQRSAPE